MCYIFFPHIAVLIQYIRNFKRLSAKQLFNVMWDNAYLTVCDTAFICHHVIAEPQDGSVGVVVLGTAGNAKVIQIVQKLLTFIATYL